MSDSEKPQSPQAEDEVQKETKEEEKSEQKPVAPILANPPPTSTTSSTSPAANTPVNNNIYVNGLPHDYTEAHLKSLFSPYGNVIHTKIMLDFRTNLSRGYGFVRFETTEEAKNAIDNVNGRKLPSGHTLLVKYAIDNTANKPNFTPFAAPVEEGPGTPSANIYVKGIPEHMTDKDITEFFGAYGKILDHRILRDIYTGTSMGKCLVRYAEESSADYAIQALAGYTFPSHPFPVTVRYADTAEEKAKRPRPVFGPGGAAAPYSRGPSFSPYSGGGFGGFGGPSMGGRGFNTPNMGGPLGQLFVRNLPPTCDDAFLFRLFGPYGPVQDVKVIRDPATGQCKGFGFVNMGSVPAATTAMQSLSGQMVEGRPLQVIWKK